MSLRGFAVVRSTDPVVYRGLHWPRTQQQRDEVFGNKVATGEARLFFKAAKNSLRRRFVRETGEHRPNLGGNLFR